MPEAHVDPLPAIAILNGYQLVPVINSPDNIVMRDVVGNKNDTVVGNSAISLLRQIEGVGFATGVDSLKVLSDILDFIRTELTWKHQPAAIFNQVNPTQNQWYTVLNTTLNAKICSVRVEVAVANETIAARLTVDGVVHDGSTAATAGTAYYAVFSVDDDTMFISAGAASPVQNNLALECRNVKVEVRKTTNAGAGTLHSVVIYATR